MESNTFLTVEEFETIPWKRLLVRCLIEHLTEGVVKITIVTFTAERCEAIWGEYFTMVSFVDDFYLNLSYREPYSFDVRSLPSSPGLRRAELEEMLDTWNREAPHWCLAKQIVTCRKIDQTFTCLTPAVGLRVLQSLVRLETKLADYNKTPDDQYTLSAVRRRLPAFIREQNKSWEQVFNMLSM